MENASFCNSEWCPQPVLPGLPSRIAYRSLKVYNSCAAVWRLRKVVNQCTAKCNHSDRTAHVPVSRTRSVFNRKRRPWTIDEARARLRATQVLFLAHVDCLVKGGALASGVGQFDARRSGQQLQASSPGRELDALQKCLDGIFRDVGR